MKVLYVNHTAEVSGAEISLLSLLAGLPGSVQALVAAPTGRLQDKVRELGVPASTITATAGSLRLHPLHTPRTLAELGVAAVQLRRAVASHHAQVAHANSIRAGIMLGLARPSQAASVVHVRDVLPPGALTSVTLRLIASTATVMVANSRYTAHAVRAVVPDAPLQVVYNPVDVERFDPRRIDRDWARARLADTVPGVARHDGAGGEARRAGVGVGAEARAERSGEGRSPLLLGVVAQLTPWKGQDTAIEALKLVREAGIDAHLLLVGSAKFVARSTRFDNRAYVEDLHARVAAAGLNESVSWLGEREDVPELLRALDALLLPSWEEPFGRALTEAMAMGVPVLATEVGGPTEIVVDGREGELLPPRDAAAWARAIRRIAADPARAARMGQAGREAVTREFTVERHVAAMLEIYRRASADMRAGGGRGPANLEKSPLAP